MYASKSIVVEPCTPSSPRPGPPGQRPPQSPLPSTTAVCAVSTSALALLTVNHATRGSIMNGVPVRSTEALPNEEVEHETPLP